MQREDRPFVIGFECPADYNDYGVGSYFRAPGLELPCPGCRLPHVLGLDVEADILDASGIHLESVPRGTWPRDSSEGERAVILDRVRIAAAKRAQAAKESE